jgi:hypothetical protein
MRSRILVLSALTALSLAGLTLLAPIAQDQSYHQFADKRDLLGIPNFWNVVSNLAFVAVGAVGLWQFHRHPTTIVLFSGMLLTGFGSAYYHWNPDDASLLWDRLPMTLCFAAVVAAVVEERVSARSGSILLWPLLAIGIFSLLLWRWNGDLRLYAWVQFASFFALLLVVLFLPPKYTGTSYWVVAVALYAFAKVMEFYDGAIYSLGSILSGHSLKHLAAAAASFAVLRHFQTRRPIGRPIHHD